MKALPLLAGLLLGTNSSVADEPMFLGPSQADHATIASLVHSIPVLIETYGHCAKVEDIHAADVPSDFVRPDWAKATTMFELWTARGCGTEFPLIVSWTPGSGAGMVGKYRW
jgi:hypothetical protein